MMPMGMHDVSVVVEFGQDSINPVQARSGHQADMGFRSGQ